MLADFFGNLRNRSYQTVDVNPHSWLWYVFSCLAPTCGSHNLIRTFGLAGWVSQASLRDTASKLFMTCNGEVLPFKWTKELTKELQSQRPDWSERIRRFKGADKWLELAIKFSWLPGSARLPLVPSGVPVRPLIDFISNELNKAIELLLEEGTWSEMTLQMQGVLTTLLKEYRQSLGGNRKAPTAFLTPDLYILARFAAITLEDEPPNAVVSLGALTDAIRSDPALTELGPGTEIPAQATGSSNRPGKAKKTRVPLSSKPTEPSNIRSVRTRHQSLPLPATHATHRAGLSIAQIKKRGTSAYTNRYICLSRFDETDYKKGGACLHWRETTISVSPMYPSRDGTLLTYPVLNDSADSLNYWLSLIGRVRLIPN